MTTDWDHDVAFLEGVLETFALINEHSRASFHFSVASIDSTDLSELLNAMYDSQYSTQDLPDPTQALATAFDQWLFRFLSDHEPRLADAESVFHISDPVIRTLFTKGLAVNILTTVSPKHSVEVFDASGETDEDEFVEFALVGANRIMLLHLGRHPC